ncbi:uncharacterized protein YaiI (UPF0178 family) [Novosphingobium kunmingense]|uniref:UPF0178 protein B0I00_1348 n=1 Tax=Novosphingobium kunmingense TaxID=1211806 RepID=A0A2N0HJK4_9SPHN|nr:uncharacterized protein YaiI (UPF0178 family) [Novosphingobium kunmingense]
MPPALTRTEAAGAKAGAGLSAVAPMSALSPPADLAPPDDAVTVLVDADACPVKEEIYRVAERHGAHVRVVANQMFRVPVSARVKRVTVSDAFDAADDWIAAHASPRTLVVTGDVLLADRALKAGATVLAHTGKPFDAVSIGSAVATRAIMADLRAGLDGPLGGSGGGPAPFRKEDRSRWPPAQSWPTCAPDWTARWAAAAVGRRRSARKTARAGHPRNHGRPARRIGRPAGRQRRWAGAVPQGRPLAVPAGAGPGVGAVGAGLTTFRSSKLNHGAN